MSVQAVLHHGHGAVDGRHRTFKLGVARFGFGVVNQDAIDPLHLALRVVNAAPTFGDPANVAIAVAQAVFAGVGHARLQRLGDRLVQCGGVALQQQLLHRLGVCQQRFCRPARECLDRRAEKQGLPCRLCNAAEGDAGHVADQGAVLLFTAQQRGFHGFALAHVGQKANEQGLVRLCHRADGQAHINQAAVLVQGLHFPARANDVGVAGGQVVLQVIIVRLAMGRGHQDADVAAQDVCRFPAQQLFGRRVEGHDAAIAFNHDDAVHRRVDHGTQSRLTAADVPEKLAPAQGHIQRQQRKAHQQANAGADGQRCPRAFTGHAACGVQAHGQVDGIHGDVVQAGGGQAHDAAAE